MTTSNEFDIRVIRMGKSTQRNHLYKILTNMQTVHKQTDSYNANICLGHFDVMVIDLVPFDKALGPLAAVQNDCEKHRGLQHIFTNGQLLDSDTNQERISGSGEENYYYPIYMIRQTEAKRIHSLRHFWKSPTNFSVITRLHQEHDIKDRQPIFLDVLASRLKTANQQDANTFTSVEDLGDVYKIQVKRPNSTSSFAVQCALYDSLELGDVIAVTKSNSIAAALEIQRLLYECPSVNDVYSYCGINYSVFNEIFPPVVEDGADENVEDTIFEKELLENSKIEYISTRFSVKNASTAWNYFSTANSSDGSGFFVTGNADAILDYHNLSETEFLSNMKAIVALGDEMYTSFNDIITRVGLKNRKPNGSSRKTNSLRHAKLELNEDAVRWMQKKMDEHNHPDGKVYVYSLLKLIATLRTMHNNCVMDDLSDLMVGGIEALIERINYISKEKIWREDYNRELQEFLDQWTSTTNAVLHLESQMAQHPELMPVRYYIPAKILQFEQCVVQQCVKIIQGIDGNLSQNFVPIIFPCSQKGTTTKAIFDPRYDPNYFGKAPLRISIPIHQLYTPWEVSHVLCHEIAHYCGNTFRNRDLRRANMVKSAAFYLAISWLSRTSIMEDKKYDQDVSLSASCNITERALLESFPSFDAFTYLVQVKEALIEAVTRVVSAAEVKNKVIHFNLSFLDGIEKQLLEASKLNLDSYKESNNIIHGASVHISDTLCELYRECFADIVMICLTECSYDEYFNCCFKQEFLNLTHGSGEIEEKNQKLWTERHTDRMALVALSVSAIPEIQGWETFNSIDGCSIWEVVTLNKVNAWKKQMGKPNPPLYPKWSRYAEESTKTPYALYGYESKLIIEYLQTCMKSLWEKTRDNNSTARCSNVKELCKMIRYLRNDELNWNELQNSLIQNKQKRENAFPQTG